MKKYSGFTLIEMLIVMGIIIILMAAGIAGGRFALQRANRIQKQSAVDNIEQALWGYYTDNRGFPRDPVNANNDALTPKALLTTGAGAGQLMEYMDAGQFDGGIDGEFLYIVSTDRQNFVVCASLDEGGANSVFGYYCTGNGLAVETLTTPVPFAANVLPSDNIFLKGHEVFDSIVGANNSGWDGETRSWE